MLLSQNSYLGKIAGIGLLLMLSCTLWLEGQGTLRIMALGNSITVGETGEPSPPPPEQLIGYRYGLKYLLQQGGYSVDFVGSQSNGSAYFSDCQHAGIGGSRDQYVERLIIDGYDERNGVQILNPPRNYLDVYDPDIILLHIGTNDITHEADPIGEQRVTAILDLIDQYEQREGKVVTVFLAQIINRREPCVAGSGCPTTKLWNQWLETMATARIAGGDNIVLVDMENDAGIVYTNEDFTSTDPQGIHPNSNGYGKMAALWYSTITNYYNTAPVITPIPDQSINEGQSFAQIALDNYVYDVEDPDSELTWTTINLTTNNLLVTVNQNRVATVTLVNPGWSGSESIVFKVTDSGVNGSFQKSATDTVTFTINEQADPPQITGQSDLSVMEDGSIQLTLSDFTIYDPDQGQSPEDYTLNVLSGSHYSVVGTTVFPEADYDMDLSVNVTASDNAGPGPVYQALVDVIPVNDLPVYISHTNIEFDEDHEYTVTFSDIEVTDADHQQSELQIVMMSGNNHTIVGETIIPKPDYNGTLYVNTHVEDPEGGKSATFNMVAVINPVNDVPRFTSEPVDTAIAFESYIYPFHVEDPDDQEVTINVVEKPSWMEFYPSSTLLAGIPGSSDLGYTRILIRASDSESMVEQKYYLNVLLGTAVPVADDLTGKPFIYPNPVSGIIHVDYSGQSLKGLFRLHDQVGRTVVEEQLFPHQIASFSVTSLHLKPGVYIYTIDNEVDIITGKLIIQRN